jgi:hypothetical protein
MPRRLFPTVYQGIKKVEFLQAYVGTKKTTLSAWNMGYEAKFPLLAKLVLRKYLTSVSTNLHNY